MKSKSSKINDIVFSSVKNKVKCYIATNVRPAVAHTEDAEVLFLDEDGRLILRN